MTDDARSAALAHIRLVASFPGYWELRALRSLDSHRMAARGSFFLIVTTAGDDLVYDRLDNAVAWAEQQARDGSEIFLGMNPRAREARGKDAVELVASCFVDLDLPDGVEQDEAIDHLISGELPRPSYVVNSGYGLHAVYLLDAPSPEKDLWRRVQRGFVRRLADLGADKAVASDESRVLRLTPYPNRKRWPDGVPTAIIWESDARYSLAGLVEAVGPDEGTAFSRNEVLAFPGATVWDNPGEDGGCDALTVDAMQRLVETTEATRTIFEAWIKRNMYPGLHYGLIPIEGQDASKPTLFKPGAELVALLYGWRFHFAADLDSLSMYGPGGAGVFAYVCTVIDRDGRTVGQGRGVAELREPGMNNANKTVKMAEKRAQIDAVLRCAGLSQWFTQDLEEAAFVSPQLQPGQNTMRDRCTPSQQTDLRVLLRMTGRSEHEILRHYSIATLDDLPMADATKLIWRLREISRTPTRAKPGQPAR